MNGKERKKMVPCIRSDLKVCLSERRWPIYYNVGGKRGRSKMIRNGKIIASVGKIMFLIFKNCHSLNMQPFTSKISHDCVGRVFDNNDPFNNAGLEVPQTPEFIDTAFLLFTQEAPTNPEFLFYDQDDETIINSNINPSRWLRIMIHGFTNNRDSVWMRKLKDGLLQLKNVKKEFYLKKYFLMRNL